MASLTDGLLGAALDDLDDIDDDIGPNPGSPEAMERAMASIRAMEGSGPTSGPPTPPEAVLGAPAAKDEVGDITSEEAASLLASSGALGEVASYKKVRASEPEWWPVSAKHREHFVPETTIRRAEKVEYHKRLLKGRAIFVPNLSPWPDLLNWYAGSARRRRKYGIDYRLRMRAGTLYGIAGTWVERDTGEDPEDAHAALSERYWMGRWAKENNEGNE